MSLAHADEQSPLPTYPGSYRSAIARCKRVLLKAGFSWSKTVGRYTPYFNKQVTTKGVRVTRVGCSAWISMDLHGYGYVTRFDERLYEERGWVRALAIAALREAGLPVDDRGWIKCEE